MLMAARENPAQAGNQHFTRSQTRLHYKAAGILPFAFQHGVPVVLLGAEAVKTGPQGKISKTMWRDFGGQREAIDEDSETTASREFAEETMGLFGGCDVNCSSVAACASQMQAQLSQGHNVLKVVHQLKKGEYHMYITQTPHIDPLMFHLALQQNMETDAVYGAEKTAFGWVALSDLLRATASCAKRYFLHAHAHTTGNRRQPVFHGQRRMQLHPCFASSLRLAQEAGLESLIVTARAAASAQHAVRRGLLPEPLLAEPQFAADTACMEFKQQSSPMDMRGLTTQLRKDKLRDEPVPEPMCSDPYPQAAVLQCSVPSDLPDPEMTEGQPCTIQMIAGVTPEHMLYWVSQTDIARQLRCVPATAADNGAACAPSAAAQHRSWAEVRIPGSSAQPDVAPPVALLATDSDRPAQTGAAKQNRRATTIGSVGKLAHKPKPAAKKRR